MLNRKTNPEHDALVRTVLDTDGELPGGEYNAISESLAAKKQEYVDGDKTKRGLIKRQLNMWAQNIGAYKNFRQDVAAAYNTKALMNTWSDSPDGKAIMRLLKDEVRLVEKVCPGVQHCPHKEELGVMMPNFKTAEIAKETLVKLDDEYNNANIDTQKLYADQYITERNKLVQTIDSSGEEWVAIPNLKSKIKLVDKATRDAVTSMGNNYISKSSQTNPADNMSFPRAAAKQQVKRNIIDGADNPKSLIYDEMVAGRIFYNDFVDKISSNTYAKLGLQLEGVNPNDGINYEESKKIADAIIKRKEYKSILDDEIAEYFTSFLEKQWNMGKKNRPNPTGMGKVVESAKQPVQYKPGIIAASAKK